MRFCPNCNNLLQKNTEMSTAFTTLKFVCITCSWSEDAAPEDTLMLQVSLKEEQSLYKSDIYFNAAAKDRVAPLVRKDCPECSNTIIRRIHMANSGETIFVCPKCEHRFINQ